MLGVYSTSKESLGRGRRESQARESMYTHLLHTNIPFLLALGRHQSSGVTASTSGGPGEAENSVRGKHVSYTQRTLSLPWL